MKRFLIAAILSLTLNSVSADTEIDRVLTLVAQNNLTLKAQKHEGEALVQDVKASNVLAGPSVEYSPFFKGGYGGVAESELVVSEVMEFPTKYAMRRKQATLLQETTEHAYDRERRNILLQAKILCIDIIRTNQTIGMLQQRMEGSNTLKMMYAKRLEAGDANILEMNRVELDCMEVGVLLTEMQNERIQLLQQLQQLNGGQAIDLKTMDFPEEDPIADYETFVKLALLSDADIQVAEASLRSAMHEVSASRKEWLPDITMGYRRNTEMKEQVNGVLVGLSFPLMGNGNRVKAAKNRQRSAEIQVEQTRLERETQLRACYQQMVSMQQVLDHSDVKMMQQTLSLLSKALQHGEISALQYYTEINSIYEKLQRHINVHCQSVKLKAELYKNTL